MESGRPALFSRLTKPDMEKRTQHFFDKFTATQGRPRTFQIVTILIVVLILVFLATGAIRLLFWH